MRPARGQMQTKKEDQDRTRPGCAWSSPLFRHSNTWLGSSRVHSPLGFFGLTLFLLHRLQRGTGWLLAPYLAWVTFAGVLNFTIWTLNR